MKACQIFIVSDTVSDTVSDNAMHAGTGPQFLAPEGRPHTCRISYCSYSIQVFYKKSSGCDHFSLIFLKWLLTLTQCTQVGCILV